MTAQVVLNHSHLSTPITKRLSEFEHSKKPLAFTSSDIQRRAIAKQIRDRVKQPGLINQNGSPLCGPAAFLYVLAKNSPKTYANYIMDLCDYGEAKIGKIAIKPSIGCRTSNPSEIVSGSTGKAISACDWVGLASLRDAENKFFSVTSYGPAVSGITLPETLAKWFHLAGYDPVQNRTNLLFDKSLKSLLLADHLAACSHNVAMFINASVIDAGPSAVPDHWVVLTSRVMIDGRPARHAVTVYGKEAVLKKHVSFCVYTWGDERQRIDRFKHGLTVEDFLEYYYGFVSATPA